MRRRRVLALGSAAAGLSGCVGLATRNERTTSPGSPDPAPTTTAPAGGDRTTTSIGGSVHSRPFRLGDDLDLIERSGTEWLHAFLDVRRKLDSDVAPEDDPDVDALRRASREAGARLFVSLQWNFIGIFGNQSRVHLPEAGSDRERDLIDYALSLLEAIGEPVELLGLGNEPAWETLDEDVVGEPDRLIRFTHEVKERVRDDYTVGDPRLLVGAFNRLYSDPVREEYSELYRRLFEMARTDDDVDGIDLHVHYRAFSQARRMLRVAREKFPNGLITVTEFSPIWRYYEHLGEPVIAFEGGEQFAARWGVDDDVTVAEYFEAAKYDRLSRREIGDFYATMPWYNVNFVDDMYRLLDEHDVEVGTFGFLAESDVKQLDWTDDWAPFPLNCLFQPAIIATDDGAHPHYLDDFRDRV